jgi:hypothetical protein
MGHKPLAALLGATLLIGCATGSATVTPMPNGRFAVEATGYSEDAALQLAVARADSLCAEQGAQAFVLTADADFRGVDAEAAFIVDDVATVGPGSGSTGGSYVAATGPEDFRARIVARCRPG